MNFDELTDIPIIDAHVHLFPQKMFDAIWNWFDHNAWRIFEKTGPEEVVPYLFSRGVKGAVLLTYAHQPGMAEGLNRFMADVLGRHPGTVGFGTVHPDDERPDRILGRAFSEMNLAGCKLHVHVLRIPMDDPRFFPIYETCLEHGAWLNVHAGRQPSLASAYGMDVAAISGVDRVVKVLERYPDLKLIVPHLGIDEEDRFYDLLGRYPNLYLDTTMVLAEYFPLEVDKARLIANSDRIMYGSDFPNIPYDVTREVANIIKLDLGEEVTRKILFENARKLFGFEC